MKFKNIFPKKESIFPKSSIVWQAKDILFLMIFAFGVPISASTILAVLDISAEFMSFLVYGIQVASTFFGICLIWQKRTSSRSLNINDFGLCSVPALTAITSIVLAFLFTYLFIAILILLVGENTYGLMAQEDPGLSFGTSLTAKLFFSFAAIAVAPFLEELIFRGILLSFLLQKMPKTIAIIVCGFVFGAVHSDTQSILLLSSIGITLSTLTVMHRSIIPSIVYHIIQNSLAVYFTFFSRFL